MTPADPFLLICHYHYSHLSSP
ncbi:predicted protein [Fibroporia radiculosa]|uniref:Uncharacterized protein n=1 Tax=Fibroporia radiculosa TaxID=599839 RepID=J7RHF5_9APHY|nr:predicted protein [Fibroporia radiculosa]